MRNFTFYAALLLSGLGKLLCEMRDHSGISHNY